MQPKIFQGVAASNGIGIGKVFVMQKEELQIERRAIKKDEVKKEITKYRKAIQKTQTALQSDVRQMLAMLGKTHARLAEAYLLILEDPFFTTDIEAYISKNLVNAEYALHAALLKAAQAFDAMREEYFKERKNDITEVGEKILRHLLGKGKIPLATIDEDVIVVAHNLLPSDTVALDTKHIRGFAIDVGGKTSHTALLAQSLELPAVVGLKNISSQVSSGQMLIVDGNQGVALLHPDEDALVNYKREKEIQQQEKRDLIKIKDLPAQTLDGKRVELAVNLENTEDVKVVQNYGAEGVGLFRTEYLFMNRDTLPSEEEQYKSYSQLLKKMGPYPTTFRTLDMGGDKLAQFVEGIGTESNPFLGLRAIRFCLKFPNIFRTQLRALLRASVHGKIRIMIPMVTSVEEFIEGRTILESVQDELAREHVNVHPNIEVGVMIETPSAALTADLIAYQADFLSIGTNDLIQYTLAVDRINENVAQLYNPAHLAILRLLERVIDSAHRQGKWVGMCGEMSSDPRFTALLLGLGLDEFSVVPSAAPRIKKIIRAVSFQETQKLAREILAVKSSQEALVRLEQFERKWK